MSEQVSRAAGCLTRLICVTVFARTVCERTCCLFPQRRERSGEDGGSQIYHGLHLQSVRGRSQSTGEGSCSFFFLFCSLFFISSRTVCAQRMYRMFDILGMLRCCGSVGRENACKHFKEMLCWPFVLHRFVLEKSYSSYITTSGRFSADALMACKTFLCKLMRASVYFIWLY